jgi:hypothetical protein
MDGFACNLALILFLGVYLAIEFTLDAIIRNLRRRYNDDWIEEGRPLALFNFDFLLRPFWKLERLGFHLRVLFSTPNWVKRSDQMRGLVIQFRVLHVVILLIILVTALLDTLM